MQKHFVKLSEMTVPGFIDNYVEKHLGNAIRIVVHPLLVANEQAKDKTPIIHFDEVNI